ncbi:DNA-formamidopyrimidine glycosylase [Marinilactibacillus kalidii]|uniref:DNA-formamidopyrimidine glycosylase n=1 Tax=Marinilactibacillus kalidii TaxID=2820274 RepID=UPI001ABDC354
MPELPEVESVRSGLEKLIQGKTIKTVNVYWDRIIAEPSNVEAFKRQLVDQKIEAIGRRGKFLLFQLTDYVLISHLRMEGKYRIEESTVPLTKHTHVVFSLDDGVELRYLDVRKFGRMSLVEKDLVHTHKSLAKLGPEPFDGTLRLTELDRQLKKRKKMIKASLLDQTVIAGIGNIYADEILFEARIYPGRLSNSLSDLEMTNLHKAILLVMGKAVKAGGTTIRTYMNAFGETGTYQASLNVYGKDGQPCVRCGTIIEKTKIAQRGTHYCPNCQLENGPIEPV